MQLLLLIVNKSDIDDVFQTIYITNVKDMGKSLGKDLGWIIDSVIDHTISISKYNPLTGSNYIKSSKELDHPGKGLVNIQNVDDNECFKWCLFRYLNPPDHHPARTTNADKDFIKTLNSKDINFPVKIRDIHKTENMNSVRIRVFRYENKEKYPTYFLKNVAKKNMLTYY